MKKFILLVVVLFATSFALAQSVPPAIFYSNLTSGPNSGGSSNAGAFVTIHGYGFGASRGSSTVTIGGGAAAAYQTWSNTAVTFQLGSAAATGNIVVTVGGVKSNGVPFTVRAGNIYFVSSTGSDSNAGSLAAPWLTLAHAVSVMPAGSITYLESGYAQSTAELVLGQGGTATAPIAIVGYPNSSVTMGSSTGLTTAVSITGSNWVLSNLLFRGTQAAVSIGNVTGIRLAGNDISCPDAITSGACLSVSGGSSLTFLGNSIHDTGNASSTNQANYQAMYLLGTTGVEIGWNEIWNTVGCNAIDAYSTTGLQYSFLIHDNFIDQTRCDAITLGSVNPALGAVSIYNNIIEYAGRGAAPTGTATGIGYAAIDIGGGSSAPVQVYNNTFYEEGYIKTGTAGSVRASGAVNLTNNILYELSGEEYVTLDTNLSWVTGTNNLFYGAGSPLGVFADSVTGNPNFAGASTSNFQLTAGSPAIDSGATVALATDYNGVPRPQGRAYDIGAYEYPEATTASAATPAVSFSPTSLTFASQTVGTTSAAQTITLTNTGAGALSISGIAASAGFAQTNTCGTGVAASGTCTISVTFTPTAAGSPTGSITFTDNAAASPQAVSLSGTAVAATPPLAITSTSLPAGTVGTAYSTTLAATGGTAPYTWAVNVVTPCSGSCNTGLNFSTAGVLSGTPVNAGTSTFTYTVTDSAGHTASAPLSITIAAAPAPAVSFSPTSLTFTSQMAGTTSAAQTITLKNTGNAALSVSGIAASAGFAQTNTCGSSVAASGSCTISVTFTPTAAGTPTGSISFTDNAAASPQAVSLTGTAVAALAVTSTSLPAGTVGTAYSTTLAASGGTAPYTWADSCTGACNSGLSFSTAGVLSGTPTTAGSSTFTFTATDSAGHTASTPLSITIAAAPAPAVSFSPTSLTFASQTVATTSAAQTITLKNTGNAALSISGIAASAGFAQTNTCGSSLAASGSCTISVTFTPTAVGSPTGSISFTDNAAASPQAVSLTGTAVAAAPAITSATSASGTGGAFSYQITATNSPTSYGATGLPAGLSVNSATGLISGTPTAAGTSTVTLSATNASGTGKATLTLTITIASGSTGITFVQSASNAQGSGQTASKAFAGNVTSGDLIVVGVFADLGATVSVTDVRGSTFTQVAHQTVASDHDADVFVGAAGSSGADTITVSAGSGQNVYAFSIHEYSGVTTTVDASATAQGNSTSLSSGSLTTLSANDLVFAWFTNGNNFSNENFSALNAAYTKREMSGSGTQQCIGFANCVESGDLVASTTLTTNATATLNVSDIWSATVVAFKGTTSGGVTAPVITNATSASGTAGSAFSYQITAANSPTSYGATGLPAGLTVNTASGLISGTPSGTGVSTVTLSATNSAGTGTGTLALTVTAAVAATPGVSLSPTSLTFASQTVATTSAAQTVTLTNTGSAALSISGIAASGSFAETTACPSSLPAGASCTIAVTFTPTAAGTPTGAITFTDNAAASPQAVSLSGTAVAATGSGSPSVALAWSEASGTIGGYNVYRSTTSGSGYAKNNSSGLVPSQAYTDTTVSAGQTYYYVVTSVSTSGMESAYSSEVTAVVPSTGGTSAPAVSLSPTSLTFASETIGTTSAAQTVTLTNTGNAALSISGIAASAGFAQTNTCGASLAASGSCTISVTFTPSAAGSPTGSISFTDNAAASPQAVSLSGTAVAAATPGVSFSPTSLTFASQTVATTSAAQTVTLTNTGAAALSISGIAASGNFAETTACPSSLPAGASCTISVTFTPAAAGTPTGAITFTDNAAASPQAVSLSGTAVAATGTAASVALAWSEASGTIGGYNVYRSTTSGSGYAKSNSSGLVGSESYTDTTVSTGQTYYYVVTSVSTSGVESAYSSQVTAVVPAS